MSDFWSDYNAKQKKIMEKGLADSKGKPYHTLKVGNRIPGTKTKPATKKKTETKK